MRAIRWAPKGYLGYKRNKNHSIGKEKFIEIQ